MCPPNKILEQLYVDWSANSHSLLETWFVYACGNSRVPSQPSPSPHPLTEICCGYPGCFGLSDKLLNTQSWLLPSQSLPLKSQYNLAVLASSKVEECACVTICPSSILAKLIKQDGLISVYYMLWWSWEEQFVSKYGYLKEHSLPLWSPIINRRGHTTLISPEIVWPFREISLWSRHWPLKSCYNTTVLWLFWPLQKLKNMHVSQSVHLAFLPSW